MPGRHRQPIVFVYICGYELSMRLCVIVAAADA